MTLNLTIGDHQAGILYFCFVFASSLLIFNYSSKYQEPCFDQPGWIAPKADPVRTELGCAKMKDADNYIESKVKLNQGQM